MYNQPCDRISWFCCLFIVATVRYANSLHVGYGCRKSSWEGLTTSSCRLFSIADPDVLNTESVGLKNFAVENGLGLINDSDGDSTTPVVTEKKQKEKVAKKADKYARVSPRERTGLNFKDENGEEYDVPFINEHKW